MGDIPDNISVALSFRNGWRIDGVMVGILLGEFMIIALLKGTLINCFNFVEGLSERAERAEALVYCF